MGGRLVAGKRQELGDVDALVPHALDVLDHLEKGRDHPEVARDGRLACQQREHTLVHLEVATIQPVVVLDHELGQLDVGVLDRLGDTVERLRYEVERAERLLLEPGELLAEVRTRLGHQKNDSRSTGRPTGRRGIASII